MKSPPNQKFLVVYKYKRWKDVNAIKRKTSNVNDIQTSKPTTYTFWVCHCLRPATNTTFTMENKSKQNKSGKKNEEHKRNEVNVNKYFYYVITYNIEIHFWKCSRNNIRLYHESSMLDAECLTIATPISLQQQLNWTVSTHSQTHIHIPMKYKMPSRLLLVVSHSFDALMIIVYKWAGTMQPTQAHIHARDNTQIIWKLLGAYNQHTFRCSHSVYVAHKTTIINIFLLFNFTIINPWRQNI